LDLRSDRVHCSRIDQPRPDDMTDATPRVAAGLLGVLALAIYRLAG